VRLARIDILKRFKGENGFIESNLTAGEVNLRYTTSLILAKACWH